MISIQAIGAEAVAARLQKLGAEAIEAERQMVVKGSILLRRALVARMSARAPVDSFWGKGSPSGDFIGARTGQTRARLSPGGLAIRTTSGWTAAVGSPDEHVRFMEKGGRIQGRQFLRIPTAAAQTAGGQDRNAGRSIRNIPGAFLLRSKAGRLWAATAEGGKLTLLYLLVRSVNVRARNLFGATQKEIEPEIAALGHAEIRTIVRAAHGTA